MRTIATSIAKTCPDCGTLNRVFVYTTGLKPRLRLGCSRCGGVVVDPRTARAEHAVEPAARHAAGPGAEVVRLPVPVALPAPLPVARQGTGLAPLPPAGRRRLPDRRWAVRVPAAASTSASFLAACGLVIAVLLAGQQTEIGPAGQDAGLPEDAVAAIAPDFEPTVADRAAASPQLAAVPDGAIRPDAATGRKAADGVPTGFYRVAATWALGDRPEAYPDPMEGMAGLQLAALSDPEAAAAAEKGLALSASERREVQRRLRLAQHDPKGIDGIFGPGTRAAIADWQETAGLPATGYMNKRALARLVRETEPAYRQWRIAEQARRERERQFASAIPTPRVQRVAADGCARLGSGEIAYGTSFRCDVRGLRESFGMLREDIAGLFSRRGRSSWNAVQRRPGDA